MAAMGPNETKLRAALATADFNPAIGRSQGWTYSGMDLKWVGDALRDVAPKLGDYGMTGSTPDSANAAFLRLAERVDARWKEMEKAGQALSDAAGAFWDADQVLKDNPASKTDPGSFTYDPDSAADEETQRLAHSGKTEAYSSESSAREQKFAAALKTVDLAYLSSSQKLAEVHGLEPPPGLDTPGGDSGGSAPAPVPGGGGGGGYPRVPDPDDPPRDISRDPPRDTPLDPPRDIPLDPPLDPPRDIPLDPPREPPVGPEPRGPEPRSPDWQPDPYGPGGDPADPTPGTPLGDPTSPQPGTYTPGGYTPVGGGVTPQASGPPPGLMGALGGGLIGGGAAGAAGMARGVGAVGTSGSSAKSIGSTSRAGSAGALGRGGTAGAAGTAGATRAGAAGATRAGAAKGAGGSRGAAGSRAASGGRGSASGRATGRASGRGSGVGGAGGGQGRRTKDERSAERDGLDSIAESSEWIDDDGAAPGVID